MGEAALLMEERERIYRIMNSDPFEQVLHLKGAFETRKECAKRLTQKCSEAEELQLRATMEFCESQIRLTLNLK